MDGKRGVRHGVGKSQKALQNPKSHSSFAPKNLFKFFTSLPNVPEFQDYAAAKSKSNEYNARLLQENGKHYLVFDKCETNVNHFCPFEFVVFPAGKGRKIDQ